MQYTQNKLVAKRNLHGSKRVVSGGEGTMSSWVLASIETILIQQNGTICFTEAFESGR